MKILAIETSCDETALAYIEARDGITKPRFKILENLVSSQINIHRPWGGVVPNLAKREHIKNLPLIFKKFFKKHKPKPNLMAVTVGPGLEPALWAGINFALTIHKDYFSSASRRIPLVGANHLEGHLHSFLLPKTTGEEILKKRGLKFIFPAVALVVSGGHTILLLMKSLTDWKKLGETRDDAVGEAFDKVAKMLNLPYPGGPEISRLALTGDSKAIKFPRPMINSESYDFSFSGLKTSVLYFLKNNEAKIVFDMGMSKTRSKINERIENLPGARARSKQGGKFSSMSELDFNARGLANKKIILADIAASFQQAAIDALVKKTMRAANEFRIKSILLSGGVAANKLLRETLIKETKNNNLNFFVPPINFNTDNAVMIAVAAYINFLKNKKYPLRANGILNL
ncbi:MAG: tRNA (adenosine(37)-N6)-threonylcarbamoyltransferase complex transferase subunit TsaD [Patescibacteria group bacterium]|nr:tRNA (adenosine(37)-N6)-threonylcarbamoyltransferase complex transferase subunit TsaD [Patescibacteria group bacterium]